MTLQRSRIARGMCEMAKMDGLRLASFMQGRGSFVWMLLLTCTKRAFPERSIALTTEWDSARRHTGSWHQKRQQGATNFRITLDHVINM